VLPAHETEKNRLLRLIVTDDVTIEKLAEA
jgi:hypothetical protein